MAPGPKKPGGIDRRTFLRLSSAALAGTVLPGIEALGAASRARAGAAVIVRFGGGVRFSEMWTKAGLRNIPLLSRIARRGTLFSRMYNRGRIDALGGTHHILTGAYGWPEWGRRPASPTIFEYARKVLKWSADAAVVISHRRETDLATFSSHGDYGPRFGATRLSPEMVEIAGLREQLRRRGLKENIRKGLQARLTQAEGREKPAHDQGDRPLPGHDLESIKRLVKHLSDRRPPAGFAHHGDDQATWFAMESIATVAPRILFLTLGGTDRARTGRWSDYIDGIQRCDWLVGKLFGAVQEADRYRGRTLFVVVPDHGRRGDDASGGGFRTYRGADESCKRIGCVIAGPGVPAGRIVDRPCEQIDILPTLAGLMGFDAPLAAGKDLRGST